jgi:uncharacterized protein YacL
MAAFDFMQIKWFIRIARLLLVAFCVIIGLAVASSLEGSPWLCGGIGGLFGVLVVLVDIYLGKVSIRHISHGVFGLLVGLFAAFLVARLVLLQLAWFNSNDLMAYTIRNAVEVFLYAAFGFMGATVAVRSDRDQFALIIPYVRFRRDASEGEPLLLDTNIVIDGRIPKLVETGFLSGTLVVPRLVLDELQRLADSHDSIKSERGKRGLAVLAQMQEIRDLDLTVHEDGTTDNLPVDTRLVGLAIELNARLLTNDENLAQVARLRGITVLNLNALSRALQAELTAGDQIEITLVKAGKDKHQGVGYLPDGAMVVVNQGANFLGQNVRVNVSGTTQTSAGRLVFGDIAN